MGASSRTCIVNLENSRTHIPVEFMNGNFRFNKTDEFSYP